MATLAETLVVFLLLGSAGFMLYSGLSVSLSWDGVPNDTPNVDVPALETITVWAVGPAVITSILFIFVGLSVLLSNNRNYDKFLMFTLFVCLLTLVSAATYFLAPYTVDGIDSAIKAISGTKNSGMVINLSTAQKYSGISYVTGALASLIGMILIYIRSPSVIVAGRRK